MDGGTRGGQDHLLFKYSLLLARTHAVYVLGYRLTMYEIASVFTTLNISLDVDDY